MLGSSFPPSASGGQRKSRLERPPSGMVSPCDRAGTTTLRTPRGLDLLGYASRLIGRDLLVVGRGTRRSSALSGFPRSQTPSDVKSGSASRSSEESLPGRAQDDILRSSSALTWFTRYVRLPGARAQSRRARPSSNALHGFLPSEAVIHTHATPSSRSLTMIRRYVLRRSTARRQRAPISPPGS